MIRIIIASLFAVSLANAQIIETPIDTAAATVTTPAAPVTPAAEPVTSTPVQKSDTVSNAAPVIEETSPVAAVSSEALKTGEELYKEGEEKKNNGTALTVIGGVFVGFASIYTILFISDNEKFGIPIGGSSNGYSELRVYLNPGFFGLPIGIPCLISGIVSSSKGRNMMEEARRSGYQSSVKVQPYMYYSMKQKETGAGLVLSF